MKLFNTPINVIGFGFAGIECALFLAAHGNRVHIFGHETPLANCNCSFCRSRQKSKQEELCQSLLTRELSLLGSPLIAEEQRLLNTGYHGCIPSKVLEFGRELVKKSRNIEYFDACVHELNPKEITIVATGSNTDNCMADFLTKKIGSMRLLRTSAINPIVCNIDQTKLYRKEGDNMLYLPLSYNEYVDFLNAVLRICNKLGKFRFVENTVEDLVIKARDALKCFSFVPVFLPELESRPYAVVSLSTCDDGFVIENLSSKLPADCQLEIFRALPGFENAGLVRAADVIDSVHINTKYVLNDFNQCVMDENLFFAGSILGLSDFVDRVASGMATAICVNKYSYGQSMLALPEKSCIGKLCHKIISSNLQKKNENSHNYDIISSQVAVEGQNNIETLFSTSVDALAKYKEEYIYGKYV